MQGVILSEDINQVIASNAVYHKSANAFALLYLPAMIVITNYMQVERTSTNF